MSISTLSKTFISTILLMTLAACHQSKTVDDQMASEPTVVVPSSNTCYDAATADLYKQQLAQAMTQPLQTLIGEQFNHLVEAQNVIAAANQAEIVLESAQENVASETASTRHCRVQLSFRLPENMIADARMFAPLVNMIPYDTRVSHIANENLVSYQNNAFIQNVDFQLLQNNGRTEIKTDPTALLRLANTVAATLLPYAINDTVVIDDQTYTRQVLLHQRTNPVPNATVATKQGDASEEDVKPVIQLQEDAAKAENTQSAQKNAADAKNEFKQVYAQLNKRWHSLDETVRASLNEEEIQWESGLDQQCAQGSETEQYTCKTRLTQERLRYLQGFSID